MGVILFAPTPPAAVILKCQGKRNPGPSHILFAEYLEVEMGKTHGKNEASATRFLCRSLIVVEIIGSVRTSGLLAKP